jgi:peptidoglycan/LPS O-acetylase OafA/YrhL
VDATSLPKLKPAYDKVQAYEGLRAVMALWVLAGHIWATFSERITLIQKNALAVDVFIILSGFVIARLTHKKREPYAVYITRRVFRIFPLYLLVLGISATLLPYYVQALTALPFQTSRDADRLSQSLAAVQHITPHLLVHITLLQGLIPEKLMPDVAYTIIGQAWSVSLELQFYIIAPFIVMLLSGRKRIIVLMFLLLGLMMIPHMGDAFLGRKILLFLIGIGSYFCSSELETASRGFWLAFLGVLGGLVIMQRVSSVVPLAIWALVHESTLHERSRLLTPLRRLLSSRPLVYLGERSYSIYLVHMIPLYMTLYFLNASHVRPALYAAASFATTIPISILISAATFRYVERPGNRFGADVAQRFGRIRQRPA